MNQWYIIGGALDINPGKLDSLDQSQDPVKTKLFKVITYWLDEKGRAATWGELLEAVEGDIVESCQTGENIREFLRKPDIYTKYSGQ